MKIGIDATCWTNRRGYGRFTRELLTALLGLDSEHEFILFLDPESNLACQAPGIYRRVIPPLSQSVTEAARAGGNRSLLDMVRMTMGVFQESIDWLYFPSVYSYFPVWNACRVAVTIHDTIPELLPQHIFPSRKDEWFWKAKVRAACVRSDLVFTVSRISRDHIGKVYGVPQDCMRILPEAPNPLFFSASGTTDVFHRIGIQADAPYFLYLGGFGPHKNLQTLMDVFRSPEFEDCYLIVVGDYQHDPFLMDRTGETPEQADRVVRTGFLPDEDVLPLLHGTLALILPSYFEGYGLPAIEAMAAGAPVVCTRHSAIPEIAPDGALFIDPASPYSLKEAMLRIKNEPDLRRRLATEGRQCAQQLSWEASARALLAALQE